jgi:NitT/TauT family transport system ATP-binding protein
VGVLRERDIEASRPNEPFGGRSDAPLIRVAAVGKTYRTRTGEPIEAIRKISFDIWPGEFISVVGPSGCGKSTLLRILAGLIESYAGTVQVGAAANKAVSQIGVVFQDANLMPWLTVYDNVMLPVHVLKLDRTKYAPRAKDLLRLVGLEGFEEKYPKELSGGMRQRVALARALIHNPAILLFDEPFGALDAMTRDTMNVELMRICASANKTALLITHSIAEAILLSERVLVMSSRPGRILDDVKIDLTRPRSLDVSATSRFAEYALHIRHLLEREGDGSTRIPAGNR